MEDKNSGKRKVQSNTPQEVNLNLDKQDTVHPIQPQNATGGPISGTEINIKNFEDYKNIITPDLDKFKEELAHQRDDFQKYKDQFEKESEEKLREFRNYTEQNKIKVVEALAIFVALFTFISADIQIVKAGLPLQTIAGFLLIFLGGLCSFILLFDVVLRSFPFEKIDHYEGLIAPLLATFTGRNKTKEFAFCNPKTWGIGYKFFLLLLCVSISFVVGGASLIYFGPKYTGEKDNKDYQITIPDNFNLKIDQNIHKNE